MNKRQMIVWACAVMLVALGPAGRAAADDEQREGRLLSDVRQLTFAGERSGEGYFSADGSRMIFQSEREPGNPFYQIYLLDLRTGETRRLSPGVGKTTCGWIHPDDDRAMFSSTHHDPEAQAKQEAEVEARASGEQRRYAWDYDEQYDIYEADLKTGELTNLTRTLGYNAEGSYSPDGRHIAFASNRHAYDAPLDEADTERFELDPSYLMDIYIMEADGSNVRRLTERRGYDGGPFFSADGKRIVWRRFDATGHVAEVWTMNVDGSDKRQVTDMGAMSWAPFFHPSGDYIVFTTNKHGFDNFELYIVDAAGEGEPARVTNTEGFDGLPTFSPDGRALSWTSVRGDGESQIFLAGWDDEEARRLLGLDGDRAAEGEAEREAAERIAPDISEFSPEISADDLYVHVHALASERMEGRLTGTAGERLATQYVADLFESYGLVPAGDDGGWFQEFEFTGGFSLGEENVLTLHEEGEAAETYEVDEDWRPLAFSKAGAFAPGPLVFAGYGIVAPEADDQPAYDSYTHLDVEDKWVIVLRYSPEAEQRERREHLRQYADLRHKAMVARERGAAGLIAVSGPAAGVRRELVRLRTGGALAGAAMPAISVTDDVAAGWLEAAGEDLAELHEELKGGEMRMGFELEGLSLSGRIDIEEERRTGRNVLGRLPAGEAPGDDEELGGAGVVIVGAHVDHLGRGDHSGSLARDSQEGGIHYGADDNASGVGAVLEIAHWMADLREGGELGAERDVIFAAWSGEELGLIGSSRFVERFIPSEPHEAHADGNGGGGEARAESRRGVAAYVNMDMVGRYREKLTLHGVGSSSVWQGLIERANVPVGLRVSTVDSSFLPTDSTVFYAAGVPILSAFTGAHEEYHTPGDTPDKVNYEGTERVARLIGRVTLGLARMEEAPDYIEQDRPRRPGRMAAMRAYLGTIPDYANGDVKGLRLSGVAGGGPAAEAGLRRGDVVVRLGGRDIENIYDYTHAIGELAIGEPTEVIVERGGERVELSITPASRD